MFRLSLPIAASLFCLPVAALAQNAIPNPAVGTLPSGSSEPTSPLPGSGGVMHIDDTDPGWTWSGMKPIADPQFAGGTSHGGGIGTFGVYTFHGTGVRVFTMSGPAVVIADRAHKMGKLKVSIDGTDRTTATLMQDDQAFHVLACSITGLTEGNHVLEVEPIGGWAVLDEITVTDGTAAADTPATDPTTTVQGDRVALFDPLDNLGHVWRRSPNWGIDTINVEYLGNDPGRAVRSADDTEFLAYHFEDISKAFVRVYSSSDQSRLGQIVQFYTSSDSGATTQLAPFVILRAFPGGSSGGWTGYDLALKSAPPAHTNTLYIVFVPGGGHVWDPELSQLSIITK